MTNAETWGPIWGRCDGLPIHWHGSVVIIPVVLFFAIVMRHASAFGLMSWALATALLVVSIILHEAAHAVVARRFGIARYAIVIHGLGGFAVLSTAGGTKAQRNLVSLAGPIANMAFAVVLFALLAGFKALPFGQSLPPPADVMGFMVEYPASFPRQWRQPLPVRVIAFVLAYGAWINVAMGVINLLPAYPLDGGAVLDRLLRSRVDDPARSRIIGATGIVSGYAVVGFGLSSQGSGSLAVFGAVLMIVSARVLRDGRAFDG
jgi:Zn-dependent protease